MKIAVLHYFEKDIMDFSQQDGIMFGLPKF
jgi:hypothetical protein